MTLTERTAYLKGLAEGLALDETKPEGKVISEMVKLLDEMANSIADLEEDCDTLYDYIEEIDEDLGAVEEFVYDDDDCDCDCCDCDDCDDEDFYEVTCPACGETVCFDESVDPTELICPSCGEEFDCTCDCCCGDECDCGEED